MTANVHRRGIGAAPASEPALADLYVRYHAFVRRALREHYVDPSELEDMTQQVFLVLLRRVDEASEKRSIGAWLYQIARRVAANHLRGRRRLVRKHGELAVRAGAPVSDAGDPEQRYAREQAWSFIRDFLESLDEEACAVFVMSEIEGLRGAEIAARLRLSLSMTYARIRSVRARFDRAIARSRQRAFAGLGVALGRSTASVAVHALATSWRLAAGIGMVVLALVWLLATRSGRGGDGPDRPGGPAPASEPADHEDRDAARARAVDPDVMPRASDAARVFGGAVVDLAGTPIRDAVVCADRTEDPEHRLNDPPLCVTSGRDGRFRILGALAQAHALEAMAHGFVPGRVRGRPTEDIRIVLHPGGVELSGVVSDVHGGPVEGAWVARENRSESALGVAVRTDEAGAFSLWVVEGPVSLAAGAEGYAASFNLALAPSTDVRIELGAESVIAGTVVDGETGEPLAGVRVGALLIPAAETYANRGRVAFSDAAGRWEIRGLQPNQYLLDAVGTGSWGRGPELVDLGIGEHQTGIRIEMIAGVDIVGRIFDEESGEGCVDGAAEADDRAQSISRGAVVHGDGLVAIEGLSGGVVYQVTVSCRGYVNGEFEVDLREGPVRSQTWPLRRGVGSELAVRVVDDTGAPLPDWSVDVAGLGQETTDAQGSAVLAGVTPGSYRVFASGPGHPPVVAENVDVGAERSEVELRAALGVSVRGTVVSSDGRPVAGALVALQRPTAAQTERVSAAGPYHAVTDAHGGFRHASVASGEYGVWVLPADAAVALQRPGTLAPGFAARIGGSPLRTVTVGDREVRLELALGGLRSIAGVVRDEEGDLIMDARVFAVREHEGAPLDPRGRPRLTDAEGRYRFDDLPAGTYTLTAYRHGGGVARLAGIVAGARGADLVFRKPGRIAGSVRAADGAVVKGFMLVVNRPGAGKQFESPIILAGSMDGRFVATGLDAGRYALLVRAPEGKGEATVELRAGEHRSGIEITLEPSARLEGRLVDRDGKPLGGWFAVARTPDASPDSPDGWVRIAETNRDGTFAIRDVDPGPVGFAVVDGSESLNDAPGPSSAVTSAPELRRITVERGKTIELGDVVVDPLE